MKRFLYIPWLKPGFTVLEILMTITIVGTVAALTLPKLFNTLERFRAQEGEHMLIAVFGAQKRHFLNNGVYADDLADLDITFSHASEHFDALNDANISSANPIVTIKRTGSYIIEIDDMANITCADDQADAGTCQKIGY